MDLLSFVASTLSMDGNGLRPEYLDIAVNGSSLRASIGEESLGWTSTPLHRGWALEPGVGWLASLSLGLQTGLPAGRAELYVCRECGDLGCGALTVNIERGGQLVHWSQFGWEDDLSESYASVESPMEFTFEASAYDETLRRVGERALAKQRQSAATGHLWWREPGLVVIDL
ncbi:hypothetical protein M3G03_08720 [Aestuariimicrobium sp. p3-SID1156]|uniref:hypothetical protein n=1 Tax=Aestuariimicrobium sp. p3-SID1156 TaxID=2916038 RepID=UPI00223ABE38|nr:hypothetical protein [Aestuariimicrobium sp. p3-SID1156]MCT1459619.1 hypothetical protein [Aestuariimicrobium sp. p3-SID1156]